MSQKKSAQKPGASPGVILGLSAVIVSMRDDTPMVFIVRGAEHALSVAASAAEAKMDALPFGPFDPQRHPTLELGLRQWVAEQTPLDPGYVEQLYTFGNKNRYAGADAGGARVISVGYLALTRDVDTAESDRVFWGGWYDYFPWEDWRKGRPPIIDNAIVHGLKKWIAAAPKAAEKSQRRARADMCFGLSDAPWDPERVLERYELLYEADIVPEAFRDKNIGFTDSLIRGRQMLYDHRRILATAMGRLRGKVQYRPVVFELLPPEFTLFQLQKTIEAVMGQTMHKQNFRRVVESGGLVEPAQGKKHAAAAGRPAALYRFREDVLMERPAPGVKMY